MRFFLGLVVLSIGFCFIGAESSAREFELTPSQKHFTSVINTLPGIAKTEWRSPVSLYVKATSKAVGSPRGAENARALADLLAERGRTAMGQPFCVHIYRGKGKELAKTCVY